jgi:hypothetical protein
LNAFFEEIQKFSFETKLEIGEKVVGPLLIHPNLRLKNYIIVVCKCAPFASAVVKLPYPIVLSSKYIGERNRKYNIYILTERERERKRKTDKQRMPEKLTKEDR